MTKRRRANDMRTRLPPLPGPPCRSTALYSACIKVCTREGLEGTNGAELACCWHQQRYLHQVVHAMHFLPTFPLMFVPPPPAALVQSATDKTALFRAWKKEAGKTYADNGAEDKARFTVWSANLAEMIKWNQQPTPGYFKGLNEFRCATPGPPVQHCLSNAGVRERVASSAATEEAARRRCALPLCITPLPPAQKLRCWLALVASGQQRACLPPLRFCPSPLPLAPAVTPPLLSLLRSG